MGGPGIRKGEDFRFRPHLADDRERDKATHGLRSALTPAVWRTLHDGVSLGRAFYLHGLAWTVLLAIICAVPYGDRNGNRFSSDSQSLSASGAPVKILLACDTGDKGATSGMPGRSPLALGQRERIPAATHAARDKGLEFLSTGVRTPVRRPAWVGIVELRI